MKKHILLIRTLFVISFLISTSIIQAATRTASVSGNWNSTTTWGGSSTPTSSDDVIINSGITLTVNISGAACKSLTFGAINANSTLTISGTNSLTVTGLITMPRPASSMTGTINVNAGSLTAGSLTMNATTTGRDNTINVSTGTLTISGDITTGTTGCTINLTSTGAINIDGSISGSPNFTTVTGSNVNYTSTGSQTIYAMDYNGNLTASGGGTKTMIGATKVVGTLNLTKGIVANSTFLTMASGSTIARSEGSLNSSPTFAGTVNLIYTGTSAITTGFEMPLTTSTLNNLKTNAGGLIQGETEGAVTNILTDAFDNMINWTGDIGNSYNDFNISSSSTAGGTSSECRYIYGSNSNTYYNSAIYRAVNTTGYTSVNIRWKQFINNYYAYTWPYAVKVQCSTSPSGPWTEIYSLTPTGTANIGPDLIKYDKWATNVGGTFYIRYNIIGYTYGINYWFIDDLIIEGTKSNIPTTVTVNGNLDLTSGTYSIASNTLNINGTITGSSAIIGGTTSNLGVTGSGSNLTLPTITNGLKDFTINRTGGATLSANTTVYGNLNLQSANPTATIGTLQLGTKTLTLGANAKTIGIGDAIGIVTRTTILSDVTYSFNNQHMTAKFPNWGTIPTSISTKLNIGTTPSWRTGAINRELEIIQTGGVGTKAVFTYHYLDSELNGNDERKLVFWAYLPILEFGRSSYNTTENWVNLSDVDVSFFPSTFDGTKIITLDEYTGSSTIIWNGSQSTSWVTIENWTPNIGPSSGMSIIIPDASTTPNDPTIPTLAEVKDITIEANGIVNSEALAQFYLYGRNGTWSNVAGTFNPNTSNVIFKDSFATMTGTTTFYDVTVANNAGLIPAENNYMQINNAIILEGNATLRAAFLPNTIKYYGANQTIINPNGNTPGYYHLILNGTGTKTLPTTALTVLGNLTMAGSATATATASLNIGGNLSLGTLNSLNLGSLNHTIGRNIINSGTLTSSASSVTFNGTLPQVITSAAGISFNNLTITNTNDTISLGTSTNLSLGGNLTIASNAKLNLKDNKISTLTGTVASSGTVLTQNTSSTPVPTGKTWGGDFIFTGATAQTIVPGTYNNLAVTGIGGITATGDITVNGILTLSNSNPSATKGFMDMDTYTLLMGATSTNIGIGDVSGIVKRTTFLPDVVYTYGNQHTSISFPNVGTLPSELSLKISLGVIPTWKPNAIARKLNLIQTGGTGTQARVYFHYLASELNGNTEADLVDYIWFSPSTIVDYGRSAHNTTEKWVSISNVNVAVFNSTFGENELTLGISQNKYLTWVGATSTSWVTATNWNPNGAPSDHTEITIPDAATTLYDPIIPTLATCGLLTLESGAILNTSDNGELVINDGEGAWRNLGGVLNANTGKVVFKNFSATISGSTNFNRLEITTSASVTLKSDTYIGLTDSLINKGQFYTNTLGLSTIEYKGGNQIIAQPNRSTKDYSTLILSGTGTKTFAKYPIIVNSNFSTSGTTTVSGNDSIGASLTFKGDVTIGAGTTFSTGINPHQLNANLINNGTITGSSGNSTTMNGTIAQTTSGTGLTNFYDLAIENFSTEGVTLNSDVHTINDLNIAIGSVLNISPSKEMNVSRYIVNNAGESGIVIKSSPTLPNGTLIYNNLQSNPVLGTVEMYTKAFKDDAAVIKYKWQFFGIPLRTLNAFPTFNGSYVRLMHEDDSPSHWEQLYNGSVLSSFKGYEITQVDPKTIYFQGELENSDYSSGQLAYTPTASYPGQHLIGNPYTAAIDIKKINFGSDMLKTVYLYNTGSLTDWTDNANTNPNDSSITTLAGQYVAIPQDVAGDGLIPGQIPSMQAFLVRAKSSTPNATVAIPYSSVGTAVKNTTMQRSKAVSNSRFTQIDIKGTNFSDRMWIIENPICTHNFDNGWDGEKFLGSSFAPQLYAAELDGDYQVNSVDDINNTELAFMPGIDTKYTMTFKYENNAFDYSELYLLDLVDNTITNITKNGSTYTFTSAATAEPVKRFRIVTERASTADTSIQTSNELKVYNNGKTIFVNNPGNYAGELYISDVSGRVLQNFTFEANGVTSIPMNLTPGAYILIGRSNKQEVTKKIIL